MNIGIDLTPLQTHHKFRGIGAVIINFINNLSDEDKSTNHFVLFLFERYEDEALNLLNFSGVSHEIRYTREPKYIMLPGRLRLLSKVFYKLRGLFEYAFGDPRIKGSQLKGVNRYIQFDQNQKLPRGAKRIAVLFLHDLIPYILESDYLKKYSTARAGGASRKSALKSAVKRYQYFYKVKINTMRARHMIANSEYTKKDFIKYTHASAKRVFVAYLGVTVSEDKITSNPGFTDHQTTLWGTVKRPLDLTRKPFILYIGGTDSRRRMVDLIAAFYNLRARGEEISLVMAGDEMAGIASIKNPELQSYLKNNPSYLDDMHQLGFVDETQKRWLYEHSLAFVFPSSYEGFGLPIIEAMAYGSPVITYKNTAIEEIAKDKVLYARDFLGISHEVERLFSDRKLANELSREGIPYARKFTWDQTVKDVFKVLHKK
ncbi:MAG: hypothetical protein JWN12_437 [Candidatus Saccharibacteria bacterium]|nr:hypothetical protein [Candidatus Saccharibacteria bacterium]